MRWLSGPSTRPKKKNDTPPQVEDAGSSAQPVNSPPPPPQPQPGPSGSVPRRTNEDEMMRLAIQESLRESARQSAPQNGNDQDDELAAVLKESQEHAAREEAARIQYEQILAESMSAFNRQEAARSEMARLEQILREDSERQAQQAREVARPRDEPRRSTAQQLIDYSDEGTDAPPSYSPTPETVIRDRDRDWGRNRSHTSPQPCASNPPRHSELPRSPTYPPVSSIIQHQPNHPEPQPETLSRISSLALPDNPQSSIYRSSTFSHSNPFLGAPTEQSIANQTGPAYRGSSQHPAPVPSFKDFIHHMEAPSNQKTWTHPAQRQSVAVNLWEDLMKNAGNLSLEPSASRGTVYLGTPSERDSLAKPPVSPPWTAPNPSHRFSISTSSLPRVPSGDTWENPSRRANAVSLYEHPGLPHHASYPLYEPTFPIPQIPVLRNRVPLSRRPPPPPPPLPPKGKPIRLPPPPPPPPVPPKDPILIQTVKPLESSESPFGDDADPFSELVGGVAGATVTSTEEDLGGSEPLDTKGKNREANDHEEELKETPRRSSTEDGLCVVCQDERANMASIDCGHLALCSDCADMVMDSNQECPICRIKMADKSRLLRIFKP